MDLPIVAGVEFRLVGGFLLYAVGDDGSVWSKNNGVWGVREDWRLLSGSLSDHGYVKYSLFRNGEKHEKYGHQIVLEAFVGPCPEGMEACHAPDPTKTNNRRCNLRWGTPIDNADDKERDGTKQYGEDTAAAKLTDAAVLEIRSRYASGGITMRSLGDAYGVDVVTIFDLLKGKTWPHIGGQIFPECLRPRKLRLAEVQEIKRRFSAEGRLRLAAEFGVAESTIRDIATGRTWRHA